MKNRYDTSTFVLTDELWGSFKSLMNSIEYGLSESEIQRRLGMLYQVYLEDFVYDKQD